MNKNMYSIAELEVLNAVFAVFEKYRIDSNLYPQLGGGDYFVIEKDQIYDVIRETVQLMTDDHPLWNFGKFPGEDDDYDDEPMAPV